MVHIETGMVYNEYPEVLRHTHIQLGSSILIYSVYNTPTIHLDHSAPHELYV